MSGQSKVTKNNWIVKKVVNMAFDVDKWSRIFDKPYVQREWIGYNINNGYIKHHNLRNLRNGKIQNQGVRNLNQRFVGMLKGIINEDWDSCASLYTGFMAFLFKDIQDRITFFETDLRAFEVYTYKMCEELRFPMWAKERMTKIFNMKPNFEEFLKSCQKIDKINFDLDSAIRVYRMQGDEAIFSILMQIFYQQTDKPLIHVSLTPGIPIAWTPKPSPYVSGTSFPVVVTPYSNKFSWYENDEGWFLQDEYGNVIDCAGVGLYGCYDDTLANRLAFISRAGHINEQPYIICWTWKEIVDAVGFFRTRNVLVRRMNEGLMDGYWFKFGLDGLMALYIGKDGSVSANQNGAPIREIHIAGHFNVVRKKYICSITGEVLHEATTENVVWSGEEIRDWFTLGEMCRTALF